VSLDGLAVEAWVERGQAFRVQLDTRLQVVLRGARDDYARVDELAALDPRDDAHDGVVKRIRLGHLPPP
jgi:hypothetical protein